MVQQGWKARQEQIQNKAAARAELEASPEFQAIRAARQAHLDAIERERAEQEARDRAEREGPARVVAELLVDRLGDDLPEILSAITKAGGLAKVVPHLEKASTQIARERREAAAAADLAEREAQFAADRAHTIATRAARIARDQERAAAREAARVAS